MSRPILGVAVVFTVLTAACGPTVAEPRTPDPATSPTIMAEAHAGTFTAQEELDAIYMMLTYAIVM